MGQTLEHHNNGRGDRKEEIGHGVVMYIIAAFDIIHIDTSTCIHAVKWSM